jgi:tetratricopeptide (TPR) repeat protein
MYKNLLIFACCLFAFRVVAQDKSTHILDKIQQELTWNTSRDSLLVHINSMNKMTNEKTNPYINYWNSYAKYLLFFQFNLKNEEEKKIAEQTLEEAAKLIEKIPNKSSDHYALLSLLGGLQLNFTSMLMVPFRAANVEKNAKKAIELNPKNIRAYLSYAIYDYYTPKMYGGMKVTEENLKKALSLPDKIDNNPFSPDWGRLDAYLYLIRFYRSEQKIVDAKKYLEEGLKLYPQNAVFQKIKASLK